MRGLVLRVPGTDVDLASDRLWSAGARALEERLVAGAEEVELVTVLADDDDVARRRLGSVPSGWRLSFVDLDQRPGERWREHARPVRVHDGLVIRPAWLDPIGDDTVLADTVLEVAIEPAGSFGLGDHPTTQLSAAAVDRLVRAGDRVLDVGCGSGVLGIVAARRGAAEVTAIDISEPARAATVANAARNGVTSIVASTTSISEIEGTFDLVVANILAPDLVSMARDLRRCCRPGGALVVSGILVDHHDHVLVALEPMHPVVTDVLDGWAAVELRHPATTGRVSS